MADKSGNKVNFIVITPYKCFLEERVSSVVVPSLDGDYGVMVGHTPLVLALKAGIVTFRNDDVSKSFSVSEGYAEIGQNLVLVICNSAEWPEELSVRKISESYKSAKADETKLMSIADSKARSYALKETTQRINRAKARVKLLLKFGTESQRERITEFGLDNI